MRVNVYAEEITLDTAVIPKQIEVEGEPRTFYGIRMFLDSPESLHHGGEDDDRSAVTFWVPWTREGGHDFDKLIQLFGALMNATANIEEQH